jgi:ParB-like chromosome segregation protein Spo0J
VDFTNRKTWTAEPDDKKVKRFMQDIRDGVVKPAILVNEPNNEKMVIADGHHRSLAAQELGVPVRAYVATVGMVHGDWDFMHSHQLKRDADGAKADR